MSTRPRKQVACRGCADLRRQLAEAQQWPDAFRIALLQVMSFKEAPSDDESLLNTIETQLGYLNKQLAEAQQARDKWQKQAEEWDAEFDRIEGERDTYARLEQFSDIQIWRNQNGQWSMTVEGDPKSLVEGTTILECCRAAMQGQARENTKPATQSESRGWCSNGHEKGQRGCALCEEMF